MINVKMLGLILASAFDVMMILFRDKCINILGWTWETYGLVVVLNEKNYYFRIVPSYNMYGKTRCYNVALTEVMKEVIWL